MDPIAQAEEERKLREEAEIKELLDTIALDNTYFTKRDFIGKGKTVVTTAKQRRDLQHVAATLKFSSLFKRKTSNPPSYDPSSPSIGGGAPANPISPMADAGDDEEDGSYEIDLTAKPRNFITSGGVLLYEPEKLLNKKSKKYLFLFNDLLLLCNSNGFNESCYEIQQLFSLNDLRLKYNHLALDMSSSSTYSSSMTPMSPTSPMGGTASNNNTSSLVSAAEGPSNNSTGGGGDERHRSFELLLIRRSSGCSRASSSTIFLFTFETESAYRQWIEDFETTLLSYHRQTERANRQLGWFHEILQGGTHSAAYLGDIGLVRRYVKHSQQGKQIGATSLIHAIDGVGMTALHWSAVRGHEVCVRFLLDRGAEVDVLQPGENTALLLAAASGQESVCRLLLERGADITVRNSRGLTAVFMAVLYGHATKGLPWTLQLLTSHFPATASNSQQAASTAATTPNATASAAASSAAIINPLNEVDDYGATPLHLCAERNLSRPIKMLVDAGAEVNSKHARLQFTPLQMACYRQRYPDVETVRSFLEKGGYPNWRDAQGHTAFDLILLANNSSNSAGSGSVDNVNNNSNNTNSLHDSQQVAQSATAGTSRWRAMEATLTQVGDWAVRALPTLMELSRRGARFDVKSIDCLRSSFKAAVLEARDQWEKKAEPASFKQFVIAKEQAGEELLLHRTVWSKDSTRRHCQLCNDAFGLTNRKHHCRSCGVLVCTLCSTKRLSLSSSSGSTAEEGSRRGSFTRTASDLSTETGSSAAASTVATTAGERVCDACFNRLTYAADQPSADHYTLRQLKKCGEDVIFMIKSLIESLDDPYGDPTNFQQSLQETIELTRELSATSKRSGASTAANSANASANAATSLGSNGRALSGRFTSILSSPSKNNKDNNNNSNNQQLQSGQVPITAIVSGEEYNSNDTLIHVLKLRESRLYSSEDTIAKFLEAANGYHRTTKKLIEKKVENKRLWGGNNNGNSPSK